MCGTREKLGKQLKDKTFRSAVLHKVRSGEMMPYFDSEKAANWFGELVLLKHRNQNYCKKTLLDIARELDQEPLETTMNLFAEDPDMIADFAMPDMEITTEMFCARPEAMPCSDGSSYAKETNLMGDQEMPMYPNAMNISYIPRYLTHYGKHNFAQAVHKASGLVAERFGINNRGEIKVGNYADFVIMNQDELHSYDTITGTLKDPEGIEYVFVNGKMAVCNKQVTQNHGGYVLRKEPI
jgi:N-acyl-D-amino-acid deacylase